MKIVEFIFENWSDIFLVFSVLTLIIYSSVTNTLDYLKADLFTLITDAEKIYGAKTGEIKLMYVVKKIYSKMPVLLKTFLSEKQIEKLIENVLLKVKESWAKNNRIIQAGESTWQ